MNWLVDNAASIGIWGVNGVFLLVIYLLTNTFVKKQSFNELSQNVNTMKNDLKHLEKAVDELPSASDIHRVELQMRELKGEFSGVNQRLSIITNQLGMLVENELKNG